MAINALVKQVSTVLNTVMTDAYGAKVVSKINVTDLSSVFDYVTAKSINRELFDGALYAYFGTQIFAKRVYNRERLPIWRDSREFGAMVLKTYCAPIAATDNQVYTVKNGDTGNTFTVKLADIKSALIDNSETWQCELSTPYNALKDAFASFETLDAFLEQQFVILENSMEDKMEKIENMLIAKFAAIKIKHAETEDGIHAVNLLKQYNTNSGESLTAAKALQSVPFLEYAAKIIYNHIAVMAKRTKMFNVEEFVRHTPNDNSTALFLQDFDTALTVTLRANTFHEQLIKLPNYRSVPFWQAPGVAAAFNDVSQISVNDTDLTLDVTQTGIIAIVFDEYAIAATLRDRRTPTVVDEIRNITHTVPQATVQNYCDPSENGVIYYIEDEPAPTP